MVPSANRQPGTGSVDLILNGMYSLHINNWGVNTNVNYKINNTAEHYKLGNRVSASAFAFRSFSGLKTTLNPNVGVLFEKLNANELDKAKVGDTGGNALLASAGLDVNFAKMAVGVNAQLPIAQNFSNQQTVVKVRGMAHVTFLF